MTITETDPAVQAHQVVQDTAIEVATRALEEQLDGMRTALKTAYEERDMQTRRADVLASQVQRVEKRHDALLARLYEVADEKSWCEEFDDEMEKLGYERRSKNWRVTGEVEVTISFTVEVDREIEDEKTEEGATEIAQERVMEELENDVRDRLRHMGLSLDDITADNWDLSAVAQ